jgi:hypothetical protein
LGGQWAKADWQTCFSDQQRPPNVTQSGNQSTWLTSPCRSCFFGPGNGDLGNELPFGPAGSRWKIVSRSIKESCPPARECAKNPLTETLGAALD